MQNMQDAFIRERLTAKKYLELRGKVKRIYCIPSRLRETPKQVLKWAERDGILILPWERRRGRPRTYDKITIANIYKMRAEGKRVKQIAEALNMPIRTVYYYLSLQKL